MYSSCISRISTSTRSRAAAAWSVLKTRQDFIGEMRPAAVKRIPCAIGGAQVSGRIILDIPQHAGAGNVKGAQAHGFHGGE